MEGINIKGHNEEELKKLKPGDLIRFYNECDEHWAVYYGEVKKGEPEILWWMGNDVECCPRIKLDSFRTCAKNMIAEKENSNCIEGVKVVERTKDFMQKLEQEEKKDQAYQDLFNSSEHFAKWCHYGLGGLDSKWGPTAPGLVIDISRVKNVVEFVEGIFTNHTSDGKAIRHNVDVLRQLQPGDIVSFSRGSYKHWATYIGQNKDKRSVIHWWDNDGATDPYIRIIPFWDLAQNCTAEKINTDLPDVTVVESEAVKRAEALINMSAPAEKGQELIVKADMFHCSEDFAKWFYIKLMGKAGSTVSMEGHIENLPFKRHLFTWKCCEHNIAAHLGKGRHLLNEGVLLTLEFDKFSQLLAKGLELESKGLEPELQIPPLELQLPPLELQILPLVMHGLHLVIEIPEKPVFKILQELKSSLDAHQQYDSELLKEIHCLVKRLEELQLERLEELQSSLERQQKYDSELLKEIRCSVEILHKWSMPEKEPNKGILDIVEIVLGIAWQFVREVRKDIEESDEGTLHLDPCSIFTRRKYLEVLENLTPGDLIKYVKNSWKHWGVYIGDSGPYHAIHWTADEHLTVPNSSCIGTENLDFPDTEKLEKVNDNKLEDTSCIGTENLDFPDTEKLEKVNDNKLEDTIINGAEVAERVLAFFEKIIEGERNGQDFSDLFNDCEHFAKWCRYGLGLKSLKISKEQIEKIKDIRNFVRGEFSVIPWQIDSHENIPVSQMRQLKKCESDISSSLKSSSCVSVPSSSKVC